MTPAPGPLAGLRVVDFGQYLAGPLAAMMLADQGADVVHVDPPGGPRWTGHRDALLNRGKQRVTLDLKDPAGLARARELVAAADVVVENFRPGVFAGLGLDPQAALAADPALVWCAIPGFGRDDPRAGLRAFEGVVAAATANCFPREGEEPPGWDRARPFHSAVPVASTTAAFLAATSVVAALVARRRTGRGQLVEVPLFDAMFTLIGHSGAYRESRGLRPQVPLHQRGAGAFRCADGRYVQFDTASPRHLGWFARAAGVLGAWEPELLDLAANTDPGVNARLHARLRELFLTRPAAEWEELGNAAGASIALVRTSAEWVATEQARASRAVARVDDPELGALWTAGLPVGLGAFPDQVVRPRRLPGADTGMLVASPREPVADTGPASAEGPLAGITVLDLGVALAAPTCGRLLAEFGAEVVKVNAPTGGVAGHLNRGKRSLLLDLGSLAGQEVYWRLVGTADVVVENFAPGTADRLAVGRREVRARRPEAVYVSVSCYGPTGPWAAWRGWERQGQAVTGIMERTGLPSVLGPYNLVDVGTGLLATFGAVLGLYHRGTTGEGQVVTASLAQAATYHQCLLLSADSEPRGYEALGEGPLQRYYEAAGGWFFLGAREADRPALAQLTGGAVTEESLAAAFAAEPVTGLVDRLVAAGVAAHRVVPLAELMTDPVVRERGLSVTQEVESAGPCTMPGVSPRLSATPARVGRPPVRPGSDAREVLAAVGLADRLEELERAWVVRASDLPPAWR